MPRRGQRGAPAARSARTYDVDPAKTLLSIAGWRIKTVPSRLSAVDLARLRNAGARPAGPPPAGPRAGPLAATGCVEVQRLVNAAGIITLGSQAIQVGSPMAGQRARIRLDGQVMHVITQDGVLWRSLPCPIPPASGTSSRASASPGQATPPQAPGSPAAGIRPRRHPDRASAHPGRQEDPHPLGHPTHLTADTVESPVALKGDPVAAKAPVEGTSCGRVPALGCGQARAASSARIGRCEMDNMLDGACQVPGRVRAQIDTRICTKGAYRHVFADYGRQTEPLE